MMVSIITCRFRPLRGTCEVHNRWQEQKGENSKEKKKIVSFSQVGKMKDDSYWEEIQQVSDDKMKATIEMMNSKEDIEGKWNALKEGIIGVLKVAKKRTKKWTKRLSKQSDEGKLKDELKARKKEKRKMEKQFKEKGERT